MPTAFLRFPIPPLLPYTDWMSATSSRTKLLYFLDVDVVSVWRPADEDEFDKFDEDEAEAVRGRTASAIVGLMPWTP